MKPQTEGNVPRWTSSESTRTNRGPCYAFPATRGDFSWRVKPDRRELLEIRPGSFRLVRVTADGWRLRVQRLQAVTIIVAVVASAVFLYLQSVNAAWFLYLLGAVIMFAVFYPPIRLEERGVWVAVAQMAVEEPQDFKLKSVEYKRLGHTVVVASDGGELMLTVYAPRRRLREALDLAAAPGDTNQPPE